jgi:hypothetical protein
MWTVVPGIYNAFTAPHIQTPLFVSRSPAIGDISSIQWALYCKVGAIYSAHPPVYAMWTVVPDIYNVFAAPHIQASIFYWTYLCCYWRYADNWMPVILQTLSQIQRISSRLRYVNCGPACIQSIYSSPYLGFNIHLNVSALLLYISRQFNASYTANLVQNTADIVQFTLCEMWCRTYTKYLQLRIWMLQYSAVGICGAIVDMTWILCALYCKHSAKDSAHPTVYAMWPVIPAIHKVFAAPRI